LVWLHPNESCMSCPCAADSAAADVAAEEAALAQPADAATDHGVNSSDSRPVLRALRPTSPSERNGSLGSQQQAAPTGISTLPSSTPHESLSPTMGYDAQQADKDSASAYAVTALADAVVDGAADGAAEQQTPLVAQSSAAAQAVDWQKVAEHADSHAAAAALHPQGSVARLRAIFEQQTGCGVHPVPVCMCLCFSVSDKQFRGSWQTHHCCNHSPLPAVMTCPRRATHCSASALWSGSAPCQSRRRPAHPTAGGRARTQRCCPGRTAAPGALLCAAVDHPSSAGALCCHGSGTTLMTTVLVPAHQHERRAPSCKLGCTLHTAGRTHSSGRVRLQRALARQSAPVMRPIACSPSAAPELVRLSCADIVLAQRCIVLQEQRFPCTRDHGGMHACSCQQLWGRVIRQRR
jgi:hypothetical protein